MSESKQTNDTTAGWSCPVPLQQYSSVLLAHGGGGKLSQDLIRSLILPLFRNPYLEPLHDGAVIDMDGLRLAFTTDSYVVQPIFFPGGDIGELAVNGTINDLAMCGATPLYLSAAFVIEEGFAMEDFSRVVASMAGAAGRAEVQLVTGDTKVVERGKGDKIFITTSGIGVVPPDVNISSQNAVTGDRVLVSGNIADHGIAILSRREGLNFETEIRSDTAALHGIVRDILRASGRVHVLRDPTRGGVAAALNEIAASSNVGILVDENSIPVSEPVRGACELLGFDPLNVANEGKLIAIVDARDADSVLSAMKNHPLGRDAALIGEVVGSYTGSVVMKTAIGGHRFIEMPAGEQLPRIC